LQRNPYYQSVFSLPNYHAYKIWFIKIIINNIFSVSTSTVTPGEWKLCFV
jgi:hypothetical protein